MIRVESGVGEIEVPLVETRQRVVLVVQRGERGEGVAVLDVRARERVVRPVAQQAEEDVVEQLTAVVELQRAAVEHGAPDVLRKRVLLGEEVERVVVQQSQLLEVGREERKAAQRTDRFYGGDDQTLEGGTERQRFLAHDLHELIDQYCETCEHGTHLSNTKNLGSHFRS